MPDEILAQADTVQNTMQSEAGPADSAAREADDKPRKRRRRRRKKSGGDGGGPAAPRADGPGDADGASVAERDGGAPEPSDDRPVRRAGSDRRGGKSVNPADAKHLFAESSFAELGLRNSVLKGVADMGFEAPTHIQSELIPVVLEGRDVLGQARTGSGKTAAFGLPLFHMAQRGLAFQSIILVPTRELALQIAGELQQFGKHTPIRVAAVYGGDAIYKQQQELADGPEIIVATPGRLMDFMERRDLHLNHVRFIVLDEVDRMLDIGFRDDIRKILGRVDTEHQTIFVSATISDDIEKLASRFMNDPVRITSLSGALTVERVEQHYLPVERWDKKRLLLHLLKHEDPDLTLVFCATKRMVDDLTKFLNDKGVDARAIHGDMPQRKRNSVMKHFRSGTLGVVVASDVAARGLDVEGISHVVNYDVPEDPEIYIHRIGRTARAGRGGVAWTFVTSEEGDRLTAVEKLANVEIPLMTYPDFTPGPAPSGVRSRKAEQEKRAAAPPPNPGAREIVAAAPPPVAKADQYRFPGGVVPTKLPPKLMRGRVRTSRSGAAPIAPPDEE